jgi:lipopolysaccharide/colanic/teichoic acid biosynthesis glycosyltransferase
MLKRTFDIVTSTLALLVALPFFFLIILLIKFETPGPAFFLQTRVGLNSRTFMMYKFRKFAYGSIGGPAVTVVKDPRMTKMGKILERFKLDELPQFINVLLGQMSVVGPRPETPNFAKYFTESDIEVLSVRPGIFGINQLIYRREADLFPKDSDPEKYYIEELMPKKIANDIEYIRSSSIPKDSIILGRCLFAVVVEPFITKWKWFIKNQIQFDEQIKSSKNEVVFEQKTIV